MQPIVLPYFWKCPQWVSRWDCPENAKHKNACRTKQVVDGRVGLALEAILLQLDSYPANGGGPNCLGYANSAPRQLIQQTSLIKDPFISACFHGNEVIFVFSHKVEALCLLYY